MSASDRVELAHEPDFVLGRLTVSPSRRELVRDDGEREVIEHRVMQVLIALSKAEGGIVTRDELTMSCWDGRVVGEDAIHRVLSRLRKVANGIGAGSIEIETITKIGYRLTSNGRGPVSQETVTSVRSLGSPREGRRKAAAFAVAAGLVLATGLLAWAYVGRSAVPLVAVGPADASPTSHRLARDLFVKLGAFPQVGSGKWQLVEAASAQSTPSLMFRTAVAGPDAEPHTNLTLLDGKNDSLLWSREFRFPASQEGDLRQHVALTAGRVLGCALEARTDGGLPPGLLRLFLAGCAALAETSVEDPQKAAGIMRSVVGQRPRFAPAWARLLMLDANAFQLGKNEDGDLAGLADTLRSDIEKARKVAPDLPEIKLAELNLLPPGGYGDTLELLRKLEAEAPENPMVFAEEADALSDVGRIQHAIASAQRAVELDPLSPAASSHLISLLAWGGATELARKELARAERLWPGTGALRDAQFAFHLRYGDPRIAQAMIDAGFTGHWSDPYLQARLDPSAANVDRMLKSIAGYKARGFRRFWGAAVQALGEFHQTDEVFVWLAQVPSDTIAAASYVLFRPGLADVRRDPRFMQLARRIGLVKYWEQSGRWPDFCADATLPYDCKREAARLNS